MRIPRFALVLILIGLLTCAFPAWAYSGQSTELGQMVRWRQPAVTFHVDPSVRHAPNLLAPEALLRAAAATWAVPNVPSIRFTDEPCPSADEPARDDECSTIRYVGTDEEWPGRDLNKQLGLTFLSHRTQNGTICEADVLLNGTEFTFAQAEQVGPAGLFGPLEVWHDYHSILAHEFGHALGLNEEPGSPEATMFPTSDPGETFKRDLAEADRLSIETVYAPEGPSEPFPWRSLLGIEPLGERGQLIGVAVAILLSTYLFVKCLRQAWIASAALLLLALGFPTVTIEPSVHALVLRRDTNRTSHGLLVTRAQVRLPDGQTRTITRLGGQLGAYTQTVPHQPAAAELRPGARIRLSPR